MKIEITPETHVGMKVASWAVLVIFMASTFIGIGTILQEQAQASDRLVKVEDQLEKLVERTSGDVSKIREDVAEIKGMMKDRR